MPFDPDEFWRKYPRPGLPVVPPVDRPELIQWERMVPNLESPTVSQVRKRRRGGRRTRGRRGPETRLLIKAEGFPPKLALVFPDPSMNPDMTIVADEWNRGDRPISKP